MHDDELNANSAYSPYPEADETKDKPLSLWLKLFAVLAGLIPLGYTLSALPTLPDQIPAHFNAGGNVTRWGSRNEMLILPLIGFLLSALMVFIPRKWQNGNPSPMVVFWTSLGLTAMFLGAQLLILHLVNMNL